MSRRDPGWRPAGFRVIRPRGLVCARCGHSEMVHVAAERLTYCAAFKCVCPGFELEEGVA